MIEMFLERMRREQLEKGECKTLSPYLALDGRSDSTLSVIGGKM